MLSRILHDVSSDQECNQKHWTVTRGHRDLQNKSFAKWLNIPLCHPFTAQQQSILSKTKVETHN